MTAHRPASAWLRSPWLLAGLVVLAMGLLHLGLALVLTRDARSDVQQVEARWTPRELEQAGRPGPAPAEVGPEYTAWSRARDLHEDAQRLAERRNTVQWLHTALGISFAVQAGAVLWRALRATRALHS